MEEVILYKINGNEYLPSSEISLDDNTYLYLGNVKNARDILLRKIVKINNEEYLVKLDYEEFNRVMEAFLKKYGDLD